VLTTIAGTIGRTVIVPGDAPEANCNQAIAIITPKADLHRQYLRYWLSSPAAQRQISQGQVTATISNLSLGQIKGLTISLPNLELQQRFAIRVEAVQRAKTAQLSALFEIDALFSSLQESAFGGHP
jgi:type I restriction enzyme S subunit